MRFPLFNNSVIHSQTDEILHAILPEDLCDGSPSGFAMTGHIGTDAESTPLNGHTNIRSSASELE